MSTLDEQESQGRRAVAAAQRQLVTFEVPPWLRRVGVSSWLTLGVAALIAVTVLLVALVAEVAIPLAIAGVLAAISVPLVDRLVKLHVPRWLAATLVLLLGLSLAIAITALVIRGIASQSDEIWKQLESGLNDMNSDAGGSTDSATTVVAGAHDVAGLLISGALSSVVGSVSGLVVSSVLALFMLLFLLKDWRQIGGWAASHLGLPTPIGHSILDGTVSAFRGYAAGLTLIGAANALVVGIGAWLLGVPLVGTIALVTFVTSYIPYLGAFVAGAFAVVIAYGSGGLGVALAMLAIVLIANNSIQNLIEPFAFGKRLRLHPLAVLITVTTGTMLFGVLGAVLAAPLTSATVNAYHQLRDAGVLGRPLADSGVGGDRGAEGE
jgi:predicted PurR-regulated permease PerM